MAFDGCDWRKHSLVAATRIERRPPRKKSYPLRFADVAALSPCCWGPPISEPVLFRRESDLIVLNGQRDERGGAGPHYFRFTGHRFVELPWATQR